MISVVGVAGSVHDYDIRRVNDGPGRPSGECSRVLEVAAVEEAPADVFEWGSLCVVWAG